MRITPLQASYNQYGRTNILPKKQEKETNSGEKTKEIGTNLLADYSYNRLMVNTSPNFKNNIEKSMLTLVKQIPLSERLADAFSFMKQGDLLITGKDLKISQKAMLECLGRLKNVIKRAFFIEEDNFQGNLAFFKKSYEEVEIINTNPDRMFITTDGQTYFMDSHDSFYVIPGDKLKYNDSELEIKKEPKMNLSIHRPFYVKAFNFEQDSQAVIERQNKKILKEIYTDKKAVPKVMFKDVAGQDEAVRMLKESILYPLRKPKAYENVDLSHGFILTGPPGTGKTYAANALKNEANINAKYINGLELESKWVGESEGNWRKLFQEAIDNQPYMLFIDEFDAVARARGGTDQYGDKVVNQILTLMTDIEESKYDIFVLAATNHFDALDPAIKRSGRFGVHIPFKLPDLEGTGKIFDVHAKNKPISDDFDKDSIIKRMHELKCSGADIKRLINDAYLQGYKRAGIIEKLDNNTITDADLDEFQILTEDFNAAIDAFANSKCSKRKPIGFNK